MAYNIAPSKQDLLVSGTNIKTINSNSVLGSGNLTIAGLPTSTNPTDADKVVAVDSSGVSSWQYAGLGSGSFGTDNAILGRGKPASLSGTANTILGVSAANALTTGSNNVILGSASSQGATNSDSVVIGYSATASANEVVAVGRSATASAVNSISIGAFSFSKASTTVTLGAYAGNTGDTNSNSVMIGYGSGYNAAKSGSSQTLVGFSSGYNLTSGASNTLIGASSGSALTTGASNVFLGSASGNSVTTGSNNICIGTTNSFSSSLSGAVAIGTNSLCVSNAVAIGNSATANGAESTAVGTAAYANGNGSVALGSYAGNGGDSGSYCVFIGYGSGFQSAKSGADTTAVGMWSGLNLSSGSSNSLFGKSSGKALTTGANNSLFGRSSGEALTSGGGNIFLGYTAGDAVTTGSNNVIIGDIAGTTTLADTIILAAGTAERIRVDSSGNMGVGTASPATRLHAQQTSAATTTVTNVLRVDSQSSGTPANGIGVGIEMAAETASGNTEIGVVLEAVTTDVTSASEDFDLVVKNMAAGATASETLRVASTGTVTVANGDMVLNTAGNGLKIKTGTDATAGLVTGLSGVTATTVNTAKALTGSLIFVQPINTTDKHGFSVSAINNGVSFTVDFSGTYTGDLAWFIINPA